MPSSSARAADNSADCTMASRVTARTSFGAGRQRVFVHQLGQQFLIERTPVGADPDRLIILVGDLDDVAELAVALVLEADIAGIDAVFVERLGAGRVVGQELVADVMEIADQGRGDALLAQAVADVRHGGGGFLAVDRDAHHFRAGARQRGDLGDGAFDIGGVGIGHRLHDDRRAAADGDIADHDLRGFTPGVGAGDVVLQFFGLVHGSLEYQVLVTFTKGWRRARRLRRKRKFSAVNSIAYCACQDRKQGGPGDVLPHRYIGRESQDSKASAGFSWPIAAYLLFEHDLFRKTGIHFSGSCSSIGQNNVREAKMPERSGLITTAELADTLHDADLRLFDCTTYLEPGA